MKSPKPSVLALLAVVLISLMLLGTSCGGSKANVRTDNTNPAQPAVVEVTTATAIMREATSKQMWRLQLPEKLLP